MKTLLMLVVALTLLASPASAQSADDTPAVHIALGAFIVAQSADLATTEFALGTGHFREVNPLLRPFEQRPVAFSVVKMGFAVGVSELLIRAHRTHPKAALVLAVIGTVSYSVIAYHNNAAIRQFQP